MLGRFHTKELRLIRCRQKFLGGAFVGQLLALLTGMVLLSMLTGMMIVASSSTTKRFAW